LIQEILQKCFEYDWKMIKKPKIKEKEEMEACKKILRDNYKIM
jgi:hypothetical protein